MINIAIIGAGGLGARHLQATAQMDRPINIQVVDVSEQSLRNASMLYEQVAHDNVDHIEYLTDLDALNPNIDVAVVATSSIPRAKIIERLLATKTVKNFVLEKVLFPSLDEYGKIGELIENYGCKAWVNCVSRMWPSYNQVKKLFEGQRIYFSLSGSKWGLGCNSIHHIDLISYLTGSTDGFDYDISRLDSGHIDSKRGGYIEFTGTLTGKSSRCPFFSLTSSANGSAPPVSEIIGETVRINIHEHARKAFLSRKENDWQIEEISFETPYQSQLTGRLISEIVDTGTCLLPTYAESAKLHITMLKAFMLHLSKETGKRVEKCLIT